MKMTTTLAVMLVKQHLDSNSFVVPVEYILRAMLGLDSIQDCYPFVNNQLFGTIQSGLVLEYETRLLEPTIRIGMGLLRT